VALSDLAKYSMTRSIARYLCDSWASCTCTTCRPHRIDRSDSKPEASHAS